MPELNSNPAVAPVVALDGLKSRQSRRSTNPLTELLNVGMISYLIVLAALPDDAS